jgi:hypothetical protein
VIGASVGMFGAVCAVHEVISLLLAGALRAQAIRPSTDSVSS